MYLLFGCIYVRVGRENCEVICIRNKFYSVVWGYFGMSDEYILNSVSERTPLCETTSFIIACLN